MTEMVKETYLSLNFPTWIIIPSGIIKALGIVVILSNKSKILKEWAYAGFFFDALLALVSHLIAKDGGFPPAAIAITALIVSRFYWGKISR